MRVSSPRRLRSAGRLPFIEGEEQKLTHDTMATAYERPWQMWKQEALRSK
jgi:hypothetical protein